MAMTINTNVVSLNAQRNLGMSQGSLATSMQRISSGLRVNSAKDDAAGLAIADRMNSQIKGLNVAARNANDGISLAQTAEGALGKVGDMLQRMRELAVQSSNATNSDSDRSSLNDEVTQLKAEIQRVADTATFNGTKLLDGNFTNQKFQVGANQGETINLKETANANTDQLGSWKGVGRAGVATGVLPLGSDKVDGSASLSAAALVAPNSGPNNYNGFDISVGGTVISVQGTGTTGTTPAGGRTALLANIRTAINGAGITGLSAAQGTTADDLNFKNETGTAIVINGAGTSLGGNITVTAQTGGFTALSGGDFSVNGENIAVGAAADSATRLKDLVAAINGNADVNVTASVVDNKLKLTANTAGEEIIVSGGTAAAVALQTGLTVGTTDNAVAVGVAQNGFKDLDVKSVDSANEMILAMDAALEKVNTGRGNLGAVQSRFENAIASIQVASENLSAARGRIVDADFAQETSNLSRAQILQQAGTAMVSQANQLPQQVLSLLR